MEKRRPRHTSVTWFNGALTLNTALILILSGCGPATVGETISTYGYNEFRPPSTLYPPGTLIAIDHSGGVIVSRLICPASDVLGTDPSTVTSHTQNIEITNKTDGQFDLSADYIKVLKADIKYKYLKDVTLKLNGASVIDIAYDKFWSANPTEACKHTVEAVRKRMRLSLVTSVLQANVDYTLTFETGADATIQAQITKALSTTLVASGTVSYGNHISGIGLYWGLKEDGNLISDLFPELETNTLVAANPNSSRIHFARAQDPERLIPVKALLQASTSDLDKLSNRPR